jgi:methylenetetrahydrofolate reductase (NADPH)
VTFKDALKSRDFAITAHVNLAEAQDADALLRQGEILRPIVDAVQLTDGTKMQMSGVAAAALLIQHEIDPIVHLNCRDRNRIALQKDLIGAAALGVTSVLIIRGKEISENGNLSARNVFDVRALDFIAYIHELKQAEDDSKFSGFVVGANAKIFTPKPDWTPKNLVRKCDAGANFIQLQMCFDIGATRNYMTRIVASKLTHRASFIAALSPLPSADAARWVRDNVEGALMPESIIERMELASDPEREGIEICAELLQELTTIPGVSGANLLALGRFEAIPAAIETSGVRLK